MYTSMFVFLALIAVAMAFKSAFVARFNQALNAWPTSNSGAKKAAPVLIWGRVSRHMSMSTSIPDQMSVNLERFVKACRLDTVDVSPKSLESLTMEPATPHDTKMTRKLYTGRDEGETICVEAFLLPKGLDRWPSFFVSKKQTKADCCDVYVRRMKSHNIGRVEKSLELLKKGDTVIWLGLPGIAKSTDINFVLMQLIKHMGESGWPTRVAYRIDDKIIEFAWLDLDVKVSVSDCPSLSGLNDYASQFRNLALSDKPVVLLELLEDEVNPSFNLPTLVSQSSRDAETLLKEFYKCGAEILLMEPWDCDQVTGMVHAIVEMSQGYNSSFLSEECGSDLSKAVSFIGERFENNGGVVRHLLAD